jgi:hypothetical protein
VASGSAALQQSRRRDWSSAPSKTIALTADLVDEYGQAGAGKKVNFALGAQTATGRSDATVTSP